MRSVLLNHGGWEVSEIKIEHRSHLKQQIEDLVPQPNFQLQTPCLFINSKYVGTLADLGQIPEKDLKYMLLEAKIQEPGPMYDIYRSQNHIVLIKPQRLYFPPETKHKFTSHILRITNLMDDGFVVYKMRTNNAKPYSVHPKQGLIQPHQEISVTVHLKAEFEASAKDKFRFEGVTIPYADESYVHEIDTIFKKMKDKTVKQMIPLELEKQPEGVVVEERDEKIYIEWKGDEEESAQKEEAHATEEPTAEGFHQTAARIEETTPQHETPQTSPPAEKNPVATTKQHVDENAPSVVAVTAPKIAEEEDQSKEVPSTSVKSSTEATKIVSQPKIQPADTISQLPAAEKTDREVTTKAAHTEKSSPAVPAETFSKKPVKHERITSHDVTEEHNEESTLQRLSEQTKKELESREKETQRALKEEKKIQLKAYENLKRDYNKALEEIKSNTSLIQTLEGEKKKAFKDLNAAREQIVLLQEKTRSKEGELRHRKPAKTDEEHNATLTKSSPSTGASTSLTINGMDLERGYPLMMVCVIAIVCFLLGNILG